MVFDVVEKDREYSLRMANPYYGTVEADSVDEALRLAKSRYGGRSLTGLRLIPVDQAARSASERIDTDSPGAPFS